MKVRMKFQKYGAMKFIGHLDVMRYFQKAFRRAGYDNEYTKGFSPHQIMSFAAPLGVGLTSDSEYVDISLLSSDQPESMVNRINAVLTEGFRVTGFHILRDREENEKNVTAMALVSSADYLISLKDGYSAWECINSRDKFREAFQRFYEKPDITINKKTKTSEKDVDIKPMISIAAFDDKEYEEKRKAATLVEDLIRAGNGYSLPADSVADVYDNGIRIYLQLDTGSAANLKPELVMEAFFEDLGMDFVSHAWQVHRLELYTRENETGKLIPLDRLER